MALMEAMKGLPIKKSALKLLRRPLTPSWEQSQSFPELTELGNKAYQALLVHGGSFSGSMPFHHSVRGGYWTAYGKEKPNWKPKFIYSKNYTWSKCSDILEQEKIISGKFCESQMVLVQYHTHVNLLDATKCTCNYEDISALGRVYESVYMKLFVSSVSFL